MFPAMLRRAQTYLVAAVKSVLVGQRRRKLNLGLQVQEGGAVCQWRGNAEEDIIEI
jgi:hypothetical protein